MNKVRDFIYIDEDKILSVGSQLLSGFADKIDLRKMNGKSSEININGEGEISAAVQIGKSTNKLIEYLLNHIGEAKLQTNGKIDGGYKRNYNNSNEIVESKVLSHYKFTLLQNALCENKLLKDLDKIKPNSWKVNEDIRKKIKPGQFIEFTCRTEFVDVTRSENMAKCIEKLQEIITQIDIANKSKSIMDKNKNIKLDDIFNQFEKNPMQLGYDSLKNFLGDSIDPLEFNSFVRLMKDIHSSGLVRIPLHIIARPQGATKKDVNFVAPIRVENLIDSKEDLIYKYGYVPNQDWKILGQVCGIPKREKNNLNFDNIAFDNINKLSDIIEKVTEMFTQISSSIGLQSYVTYPNISLNLIALYREIE